MQSSMLLHSDESLSFQCPCCYKGIVFNNEENKTTQELAASVEGATLDCNHCNALLIIKQQNVYPFHEWMHAKNPEWPADGKDTDSITLSPPSS